MKTLSKSFAFVLFLLCFLSARSLYALWSPPTTLDSILSTHGNEIETQVAVDPNGNAVNVWLTNVTIVFPNNHVANASNILFGGNWSNIPIASGVAPVVGVDSQGNAVAMWLVTSGVIVQLQAATLPLGGNTWNDASNGLPSATSIENEQIAVDPAGNAVAVWEQGTLLSRVIQSATLAFGSNTWVPATAALSTAGSTNPQVAVDSHGNAFAVWQDSTGTIQGATLTFGSSTWVATSALSLPGSSNPQIAVDPAGHAIAVWVDSTGTIQGATLTFGSSTWIATLPLSLAGSSNPSVGVDSSGNAIAVWQDSTGTIQGAKLAFGSLTWIPTSALSAVGSSSSPRVAVDPAGDALAVWLRNESSFGGIAPEGASLLAGETIWSTPMIIGDVPNAEDIVVAVDSTGYGVAAWNTTGGSQALVEAATWTPAPIVTNVNPNSGPPSGGNTVIITGTNFQNASQVFFGANSATFIVNSRTQITATAPAGTGTVDVTVMTPAGTSLINANDKYTYTGGPVPPTPVGTPRKFHGTLTRKHHLHHHKNFTLRTRWKAPTSSTGVAYYRIYEDGKVVRQKRNKKFIKHVVSSHHLHRRYQITAVGTNGTESAHTKLKIVKKN